MNAAELKERLTRLRIPVREIAKMAGLDEDNVHRILKGRSDARQSSLRALDDALLAEERGLKRYLDEKLAAERSASGSETMEDAA